MKTNKKLERLEAILNLNNVEVKYVQNLSASGMFLAPETSNDNCRILIELTNVNDMYNALNHEAIHYCQWASSKKNNNDLKSLGFKCPSLSKDSLDFYNNAYSCCPDKNNLISCEQEAHCSNKVKIQKAVLTFLEGDQTAFKNIIVRKQISKKTYKTILISIGMLANFSVSGFIMFNKDFTKSSQFFNKTNNIPLSITNEKH